MRSLYFGELAGTVVYKHDITRGNVPRRKNPRDRGRFGFPVHLERENAILREKQIGPREGLFHDSAVILARNRNQHSLFGEHPEHLLIITMRLRAVVEIPTDLITTDL